MTRTLRLIGEVGAVLAVGAAALAAQELRTVTASRLIRGEEELRFDVKFAVGELRFEPASGRHLYRMRLTYDKNNFEPIARFNERATWAVVGVEALEGGDFHLDESRDLSEYQKLDIQLTPGVPAQVKFRFGAGRADVELGGLSLTYIDIATGASETEVRWSEPNRVDCARLEVSVGAVDFAAYAIGNSGCQRMRFRGGVGSMLLDFTGAWRDGAEVDIALALGDLELRFPQDLGVEVHLDKFLAGFDRRSFEKRGNVYYSENWEDAPVRVRLEIDAAISSIDVTWVEER